MKSISGLRKRWLVHTVGVICALGMVCALAVTAFCAVGLYSDMESELIDRAETTLERLEDNSTLSREEFYDACLSCVRDFEDDDELVLQFVDSRGIVVSASDNWTDGEITDEAMDAMNTRDICSYLGNDPQSGRRVLAVSAPLICNDGQVVGALRYAAFTRPVDMRIARVALIAFGVLLGVLVLVSFSGSYFIRTVMMPVREITEKAKKISGGSYGIQIQTRYDDEIGELAETINELSAKISQNEKMQAEFISQLSHELRTPLTVINGWSETLLMDENMDDQTRQGMKVISREAKRLTEMVVELLDFTRMQDGRMTLHVETTDIRSEFEDTVFMYSSRLAQEGLQLNYIENDDCIPRIPCDPQRLRQVWLNILDNAAKHGGEGGRIEASIHDEGDQVVVRIRDYGPGIPDDEIPLVKKKFYKGSSKARGTGIGLAVCDEIVEMHGGSLTLENADGGGTLVTIALPAAQ